MTNEKCWWKKTAKTVYGKHPGLPEDPKELARLVMYYTHKADPNYVAFWISPEGEVEIVKSHNETPEVKDRGSSPSLSGWIRGRVATSPREVVYPEPEDPSKFQDWLNAARDVQVINIYGDGITDYTESRQALRQLTDNLDRAPVMIDSDAVVVVSTNSSFAEVVGYLDDLKSLPILQKIQKTASIVQRFHPRREGDMRQVECDGCHRLVKKGEYTEFNGPKYYGNICNQCAQAISQ